MRTLEAREISSSESPAMPPGLLGTAQLDAHRPANRLTGGEQRIPRCDLLAYSIPRRLEHSAQPLQGVGGEPLVGLGSLVPPFLPFRTRPARIPGEGG
jgi:hypothetical protein